MVWKANYVIFAICTLFLHCNGLTNIDPIKCRISGPGIENAKFHMPVRYFFVTLVDNNGQRLNKSAGDAYLVVDNLNQSVCSIWSKIIDRHDGSYVVRYKIFKTCSILKLAITTPEGAHLAESPYTLEGPLYSELCACPQNFDDWTKSMECPNSYDQIDADLSSWSKRSIDFSLVLEDAAKRWAVHPGAHSYCHYVIIDNEISRKCYGQHIGFNMFSDAILKSITRKVRLPNTQFLINLGDWPLEKRSSKNDLLVPMFSWCGSIDSKDIVLPTYDLTEATLEMMGRQSLDIFSSENYAKVPWDEKVDKAFWRGRDSSEERLKLVSLSKKNPELLDAGITRFFFFRDRMDEFGPEVPVVSYEDFFKYKYQITLDGTVAAYRLPYLLAGNGLVLKQDSPYYEHFYNRLEPWKHYVPVKRDLSDLIERIEWARAHDAESKEISRNGQLFARKYLNPKEIFCYHVRAIKDYTDLLTEPPNVLPTGGGFERVEQPNEARKCHCEENERAFVKSVKDSHEDELGSTDKFTKDEL